MEKKDILIDYDLEEDILSLFKLGEKSKFSLDIDVPQGNLVVDYGFDGKVVGLEFFNASAYFPQLGSLDLSNAKAEFRIQYGSNWAMIFYFIYLPGVQLPIKGFFPAPYNKKMILEV
jgi:uncharacterized protein YuzE